MKTFQIDKHWYRSNLTGLTCLLLPFSWLFWCVVKFRQILYRLKIKKTYHFPAPVIVVGNIVAGGTGKTPFVIELAHRLKQGGWRPGIVSRGVGGKQRYAPRWVEKISHPQEVGDEALLLKQRTQCPVIVGVDRIAAVTSLLKETNCNVVISDDGLQHYRLGRDIEIVIVDGERLFGNGQLLPAGPLREPVSRLNRINFVVYNGGEKNNANYKMSLQGSVAVDLLNPSHKVLLANFDQPVHAVAAIGNPERFFNQLRAEGLQVIPHSFPDHYLYQKNDLRFEGGLPILMTEKDGVKCRDFGLKNCWYVPVEAKVEGNLWENLLVAIRYLSNKCS